MCILTLLFGHWLLDFVQAYSLLCFYWSFQAKALAEKNKRDLLAQKEQTERNVNFLDMNCVLMEFRMRTCYACLYVYFLFQRLAEALDADIKRWASGKEGNLRALLSTLQYVCIRFNTCPSIFFRFSFVMNIG